jgi:hypothetical protein
MFSSLLFAIDSINNLIAYCDLELRFDRASDKKNEKKALAMPVHFWYRHTYLIVRRFYTKSVFHGLL